MIKLSVDLTPGISWEAFTQYEPYSIALDGYVADGPKFTEENGPKANFNHHENCDRLATRATCAQVLMSIRQGLFKRFRKDGVPHVTAYVNDCDEDVCTSWFLLKNQVWAGQPLNPLLNRLVMMEDALDATAGAYPFPADLPVLGELAWIFEPYRQFRLSGAMYAGTLPQRTSSYRSIIEDVTNRIERHITGNGLSVPLDTRYERIGGGEGWAMVREIGAQARTGMFADGISAYVSVRERGNGRYTYVVGRMSPFIPFNCERIYTECNKLVAADGDVWGGSNTIGGSPRVAGSKITPDEMIKIVESVCR